MLKVSDLGVTFDGKLNFTKHIEATVSGAIRTLRFIKRSLAAPIVLFNAYVTFYYPAERAKVSYI